MAVLVVIEGRRARNDYTTKSRLLKKQTAFVVEYLVVLIVVSYTVCRKSPFFKCGALNHFISTLHRSISFQLSSL